VAFQNANHSVRVSDAFMEADRDGKEWRTRFVLTGDTADVFDARELMREIAEAAHACGDPGIQFDDEINRMHTCPETSPIRASNPCSEFMHVDDSACNLASIRLTAFLNEQGFDTDAFRRVIDILITAQDILVDKSSYPSEETTRNSHELRALGLGYADLGALLMCLAAPYDSEEARAWAATISAVLTGEAYLWSSRIAEIRGAFKGFPKNRSSMLRVLETHRERLENVAGDLVPEALFRTAQKVWDDALDNGRRFGYANCQVTALAPTGTIAFMMDCDTSGVEPEMALVKYKKLSGGGALKIVNRRVATALRRLGYTPEAVGAITEYIETTGDDGRDPALHFRRDKQDGQPVQPDRG
jgi:ribonucleoside-diphosphate reductase alpha chain